MGRRLFLVFGGISVTWATLLTPSIIQESTPSGLPRTIADQRPLLTSIVFIASHLTSVGVILAFSITSNAAYNRTLELGGKLRNLLAAAVDAIDSGESSKAITLGIQVEFFASKLNSALDEMVKWWTSLWIAYAVIDAIFLVVSLCRNDRRSDLTPGNTVLCLRCAKTVYSPKIGHANPQKHPRQFRRGGVIIIKGEEPGNGVPRPTVYHAGAGDHHFLV